MEYEVRSLLIDNGTSIIKAGFDGGDAPRAVFPTVVGMFYFYLFIYVILAISIDCFSTGVSKENTSGNNCFGDEAVAKQDSLNLKYPIEHGIVTDWDAMEQIWNYTLINELRVDPSEHPLLMTESPLNPKLNREKTFQIMFETFNCPSGYLIPAPALALYSSARTTGTVVSSGHSITHIVPIYEGHVIQHAVTSLEIGGADITRYLRKLLSERGNDLPLNVAKEIKESLGFIALNAEQEANWFLSSAIPERAYVLPDGKIISVGVERFICPEPLFVPYILGMRSPGLTELIYDSVMKTDEDIRAELFKNVFLSGGNTMFEGIAKRVQHELEKLVECQVKAPPERKYSVWNGGSTMIAMSTFKDKWVSKEAYDEYGATIVHYKCF